MQKNHIIMTITLSYNPKNRLARTTMDYILSLGVFTLIDKPQAVRKPLQRKSIRGSNQGI